MIDFLYRYPDTVVVGHDLARLDVPGGKQALPAPANPRLVHVHALDKGVKKILLCFTSLLCIGFIDRLLNYQLLL